jgi:hypothetical protein
VNSTEFQQVEFRGDLARWRGMGSSLKPGAVKDAAVLGPVKAKPSGVAAKSGQP